MNIEKATIKCETVYNADRTHKFLLKRTWDKEKAKACIIMLNPGRASTVTMDTTTYLVMNNTALLDFGEVNIVNLFSGITSKLNFKNNTPEELNLPENDEYIRKTASECDAVIIAWGLGSANNQHISARADEVMEILKEFNDKLYLISDGERVGVHPLTPSVRVAGWELETYIPK